MRKAAFPSQLIHLGILYTNDWNFVFWAKFPTISIYRTMKIMYKEINKVLKQLCVQESRKKIEMEERR